jgi:hypothetical protein
MSRRRSRGQLKGFAPDSTVGVVLLAAGVGIAWWLWKKNTPSGAMAALPSAGCGCGK